MKRTSNKRNTDEAYQNTLLLLKNYRYFVWSINIGRVNISEEIESEFGIPLQSYLDILYGAGVTKYDVKLENTAKAAEYTNTIINLINEAANVIREKHPEGEMYYKLLYYCFLSKTYTPMKETMTLLANEGYYFSCSKTFYNKRNTAINALSTVLWGGTKEEFTRVLNSRTGY